MKKMIQIDERWIDVLTEKQMWLAIQYVRFRGGEIVGSPLTLPALAEKLGWPQELVSTTTLDLISEGVLEITGKRLLSHLHEWPFE